MKKETFYKYGGFDEFYYNKMESFELSVKLSLAGEKCICLPDTVAFHSQGAGRNQYYFDFYQQEAYFWTNMGNKIVPDICEYYNMQITEKMHSNIYNAVMITQTRDARNLIELLNFRICSYYEINGINPNKVNLYDLLPYSMHKSTLPIIFFVENIMNLSGNVRWISERNQEDIVMDTYGNLLYTKQI